MSRVRVQLRGTVPVALAPGEASTLFTPSGERAWAHGWDPTFPAAVPDETAPGTVFQTTAAHGAVTWVVAARRDHWIRYALIEAGVRAGTVEVRCEPAGDAAIATVVYDLTALSSAGDDRLQEFASGYEAFMEQWRAAIAAALRRP